MNDLQSYIQARKLRVLVVDDAPATAKTIAAFLREEFQMEIVGTARTGPEALSKAGVLHPELALVDLFMPGMSGLEVVRTLHKSEPHMPIIVVSMLGKEMEECSLANGASAYVIKNRIHLDLAPQLERIFAPISKLHIGQ